MASPTPVAGMTPVHDHDWGNQVARQDRQTSPGSGSFTIGYTATVEETAMAAVAIAEIIASAAAPQRRLRA